MKKRISYIDIARAIAILFIVLGHTIVHSEHCGFIFKFLYSFHVVLFFILSGYTFKVKEDVSVGNFLKNKFIRIMVPYFVWSFVFLIPYLFFGGKIASSLGTSSSFDFVEQLMNILYANGNLSALKQNSSLWFLPALFSMEIIYYFIIKISNKLNVGDFLMLLLSVVTSYITSAYLKFYFPWGINTALNLGCFFLLGYLLNKHGYLTKKILFKPKYMIPIFLIGVCLASLNTTVSCIDYKYGNVIFMLGSGFSLSLVTIYIAFLINKNKLLEYLGKNTMGILIFHKIVVIIFQTKLGLISGLLVSSNLGVEFLVSLLVVGLSVFISLVLTEIVRRIFPLLIGETSKGLFRI